MALKIIVFKWLKDGDTDASEAFQMTLYEAMAALGYERRHVSDRIDQVFESLHREYRDAMLERSLDFPDRTAGISSDEI